MSRVKVCHHCILLSVICFFFAGPAFLQHVMGWRYIYSSNIIQGPCVYADFDNPATGTLNVRHTDDEIIEPPKNWTVRPPRRPRDIQKRVVSGKPATATQWPWLVAILTRGGPIASQGSTWDINCGGTLVHPEFVLTAAHCVITTENSTYFWRRNPSDLLARIGDYNLYTEDMPLTDIVIDKTYTHPLYQPLAVDTGYDIALLHLSQRYVRRDYDPVRVACLPNSPTTTIPAGSPCYVAGWGAVSTDGNTSPIPLSTTMEMTSFGQCQQSYGFNSDVSNRLFCVGPHRGSSPTDTCTGDSGGGIFCRDPNGRGYNSLWQLIGLVSFGGSECAPKDLTPGVYTNVAFYRQWILDTIGGALIGGSSAQPLSGSQMSPNNTDPYTAWLAWYYQTHQNNWKRSQEQANAQQRQRKRPIKPLQASN